MAFLGLIWSLPGLTGPFWALLGLIWAILGLIWSILGLIWPILGLIWTLPGLFGPYYTRPYFALTAFNCVFLGLTWPYLDLTGPYFACWAIPPFFFRFGVILGSFLGNLVKKPILFPITIIFVYIWDKLRATNGNLYNKMGSEEGLSWFS